MREAVEIPSTGTSTAPAKKRCALAHALTSGRHFTRAAGLIDWQRSSFPTTAKQLRAGATSRAKPQAIETCCWPHCRQYIVGSLYPQLCYRTRRRNRRQFGLGPLKPSARTRVSSIKLASGRISPAGVAIIFSGPRLQQYRQTHVCGFPPLVQIFITRALVERASGKSLERIVPKIRNEPRRSLFHDSSTSRTTHH